jgi:signal transduction histidine kinase
MKIARRLSTRLLLANLLVLGAGGAAFAVTFRLLASQIFDDRLRRGAVGGGPFGPGGQGHLLLEAFQDSVDIALAVSVVVGVIVAALVAWLASQRLTAPIDRVRETTRAIAEGDYQKRVVVDDVRELGALADDVNQMAGVLEHTERRRASLISDVTHELRTPLASIDGFVEGSVDGLFSLEEMHEAVTDETARMVRLIDDLSVLSKATEHALNLDMDPIRITSVVRASIENLRPQYSTRSVSISRVGSVDPEVTGDAVRLQQVLTNLLTNALGHVADGGSVTVEISESEDDACVAVTDGGEGIAPDDLGKVFDRFFRADAGRRRPGSGLGLSVARGIAQAHGGSLTARSSGPGEGSTFTLLIPLR